MSTRPNNSIREGHVGVVRSCCVQFDRGSRVLVLVWVGSGGLHEMPVLSRFVVLPSQL